MITLCDMQFISFVIFHVNYNGIQEALQMLDSTLSYMSTPDQESIEEAIYSGFSDFDEPEFLPSRHTTKTVIVPRVQSMQDYVLKHYKRMILAELNNQLRGGTLIEIYEVHPELTTIRQSDCSFGEMAFWRYNSYTLLVDVSVALHCTDADSVDSYDLYCELWIDMRAGMSCICGESGYLSEKPPRDYWMLSNYLVPILRKDEVEKGAEELLLRYCPAALDNREDHNAFALAQQMGLTVERYPLYRQNGTLSMLFFSSGTVQIAKETEAGNACEFSHELTIPAGTILINTNAVHKDYCQLEIYHECIHYDWHYMFFRLQDMHNSDIKALRSKRIVITNNKTPTDPLKWMEWQARRGSFGLMMPLGMMRPLVERLYISPHIKDAHSGKKFDRIARSIARDYDLPKFRVRARLIQMGYIAAQGALNYVDGRYIEPFAFSVSNNSQNTTFVIDRENVYAIYKSNAEFREHIRSGRYIYVDGHVCVNDNRFIRNTASGVRLTPWANAHVDECCLRFVHIYEQCGIAEYRFGAMNSDEEYNQHYFAFAESKNMRSDKEKLSAMTQMLDSLPNSFPAALIFLMKHTHTTIEMLEEKSYVPSRTISRLRSDEHREYSLDQIIAICIALHLPPWLSRALLQRAGFTLRSSRQHQAYQFVLDCLFMDSIDDVQKFLEGAGCQKLKLKSPEA